SDLLGSAQTNLANTLDGRQSALEQLSIGLVKKSEDIETLMRSFENLVEKSLEKAEGRTRSSAEQIREAIGDVVEAATQRFATATEELRKTAGNIRTELEDTRAEIKRGVMQL